MGWTMAVQMTALCHRSHYSQADLQEYRLSRTEIPNLHEGLPSADNRTSTGMLGVKDSDQPENLVTSGTHVGVTANKISTHHSWQGSCEKLVQDCFRDLL